jgi:hypothetical protein
MTESLESAGKIYIISPLRLRARAYIIFRSWDIDK